MGLGIYNGSNSWGCTWDDFYGDFTIVISPI